MCEPDTTHPQEEAQKEPVFDEWSKSGFELTDEELETYLDGFVE